uniref:Uncharacterized protein LOC102808672 n=1 Tax=Saccoglossus kowalevskii TaxID=10224 RepID=A0ABM0MGY8_SACKO|nr:PREDICTED: uncharacterized protein LOC102808672 [Saccoglossus kowalevskii]
MGGERRCPAVQLTEDQIEELRMGSTKCDRHEFNDTKGMQRYTEDSLRRLAASAQSIYEQITETGSSGNYCPFDTEIHEVCRSDPPMGTTRPEVPYPQKIIGESTVLLVAEDSAKLQGDYKNLLLPNKLYSSMCMSQSFVESWNKYAQIAYHYFVGQKPDSSYARVFPDVIFGQDTDACNKRDELVKRLQKETDLTSRLNSKNVMIVLQYEDESSLSLMKNTIHAIADDLTPMDQIGMVTSAGTHHDSQMELFTRENEMQFLNFIDDMMYSEPIRDIRDTVEEGFTVLKANKHGCSFALIILTDTLLKQGLVQTVEEQNKNFNSTVFVYLYGYAATDMYARDVAIETACTNAGAWDIMPSEVLAADRVKNYLKFLPTNLNSVILPVWFESQYDLLMPDVSSNAMVSCMPILSGSALLGTLCDYIAMETIEQFSDSSEVLVSLRNNTTTCMRVYLTEDELNDIRRVGAKCKTPEPKVLTAGGIVGIVFMVVGVVALVVVIVYICIKKRTYDKIYYFFKSPLRKDSPQPSSADQSDHLLSCFEKATSWQYETAL